MRDGIRLLVVIYGHRSGSAQPESNPPPWWLVGGAGALLAILTLVLVLRRENSRTMWTYLLERSGASARMDHDITSDVQFLVRYFPLFTGAFGLALLCASIRIVN